MERVGIDSLILIYLFENHVRYAGQVEQLFRSIERKRGNIIFSVLGVTEIFTGVKKKGSASLLRKYIGFFQYVPYFSLIDVDFFIAERAADLRARYNLRTPDAIHLATSIEREARFFISNDKKLKAVKEIEVRTI